MHLHVAFCLKWVTLRWPERTFSPQIKFRLVNPVNVIRDVTQMRFYWKQWAGPFMTSQRCAFIGRKPLSTCSFEVTRSSAPAWLSSSQQQHILPVLMEERIEKRILAKLSAGLLTFFVE